MGRISNGHWKPAPKNIAEADTAGRCSKAAIGPARICHGIGKCGISGPAEVTVDTAHGLGRAELKPIPSERNGSEVVRPTGLEPVRCYSLEPESSASANSATGARRSVWNSTPVAPDKSFSSPIPQSSPRTSPHSHRKTALFPPFATTGSFPVSSFQSRSSNSDLRSPRPESWRV